MRIWAVGGGKGGTGKSLIAYGLAKVLAERGADVVLVDTDYGGPNLHTYCGMRRPGASLAQFFQDRKSLVQLALATPVAGLRLIPGNIDTPDTDSMVWAQKQKLFRHLRQFPADHAVLDLGAGGVSSFILQHALKTLLETILDRRLPAEA